MAKPSAYSLLDLLSCDTQGIKISQVATHDRSHSSHSCHLYSCEWNRNTHFCDSRNRCCRNNPTLKLEDKVSACQRFLQVAA